MLEMDKKIDTYELELQNFYFSPNAYLTTLKKIADFNKSTVKLWSGEVSYRGRDYGEGTAWQVYLRDVIEFRFNRNDNCNFL